MFPWDWRRFLDNGSINIYTPKYMTVIIMTAIILKRPTEVDRIGHGWYLVHGRRKTGKTYLVRNFVPHDAYFFVSRDGLIYRDDGTTILDEALKDIVKIHVDGKRRIVIDEFQRLPGGFQDFLHFLGGRGDLVLISSTLWLAERLISGAGSPVLGLVAPVRVGPLSPEDAVENSKRFAKSHAEIIEASIYLSEPILARYYSNDIRGDLSGFLDDNRGIVEGIILDAFREEERRYSLIYRGILQAVGSGKNTSTVISSYLFSRRLVKKDAPSMIQKHLEILVRMGFLEKVPVFSRRKYIYRHVSPLLDLHYYLEEKYAYTEREIPREFIRNVVDERVPRHVEHFIVKLISRRKGLSLLISEKPEVDGLLCKFSRPIIGIEVKWGKTSARDLRKFEEKMVALNVEKGLFVSRRPVKTSSDKIDNMTIREILEYDAA